MKKLIFYSLAIFVFLSCEKKTDPTPVTPVLKGLKLEVKTPSIVVNSYFTLVYANEKLVNMQRTDTIRDEGLLRVSPATNNILSEEIPDNFKLVSENSLFNGQTYKVTTLTNTAKKIGANYEIRTFFTPNFLYNQTVEMNSNNQISKSLLSKVVSTDGNGNNIESIQNSYYRYEYDSNGNIIKVLQTANGNGKEVVAAEYTYDSNPNPYQVLKWVFRLSNFIGAGISASESKNNIIISKQYYADGSLQTETKSDYTYDSETKYPLTQITTGTSNSPNKVTPSKIIFKY